MDVRKFLGDVRRSLVFLSLIFTAAFVLLCYFSPAVFDFDLGRHLLFGQLMVDTGKVINYNLLSYTNTEFKYINSHWLSEVVFYLIYKPLGENGLIVFGTVIAMGTAGLLFLFARKRVPLPTLAVAFFVFASFMVLRVDIRPELFSYLFASIFTLVLFKNRERSTRWLWLLAPLQVLWVNMHIYFAVGPFLVFLFLVESFVLHKQKLTTQGKGLLIALIATSAASLVNPNHIFGAVNPLFFSRNYGYAIDENQSFWALAAEFSPHLLFPYILLLATIGILLLRYRTKLMPIELAIIPIFGIASILAYRNFFLFLYIAFFTSARLCAFGLGDVWSFIKKNTSAVQAQSIQIAGFFLLCMIIFSFSMGIHGYISGVGLGKIERGKAAVDFFIENDLSGPIYNNIDFGQYLAHRLYPNHLVYVDGRPEAYPAEFLATRYTPSYLNPAIFQQEDERYHFNVVFIYPVNRVVPPLAPYLLESNEWKLVHLRSPTMVFLRNSAENQPVIAKYALSDTNFALVGRENMAGLMQYALLFDTIGWTNAAQTTMTEILRRDPSACGLRRHISRGRASLNIVSLPIENNCLGFGWWW